VSAGVRGIVCQRLSAAFVDPSLSYCVDAGESSDSLPPLWFTLAASGRIISTDQMTAVERNAQSPPLDLGKSGQAPADLVLERPDHGW
jgi:hypothetical protein